MRSSRHPLILVGVELRPRAFIESSFPQTAPLATHFEDEINMGFGVLFSTEVLV